MREDIKNIILKNWPTYGNDLLFDHLGMATFSLKNKDDFELFEFHQGEERKIDHFYFDLASLTKPLTMGALALKEPSLFTNDNLLMLEHRAGIPAWAILGKSDWQGTLESFDVKKSSCVYSDLSMLKLMLILEKQTGQDFKSLCDFFWDDSLCFWKDLPEGARTPDTGFRKGSVINGEVNDDNCFKINRFCSHAGLFSTLEGLVKSLYNLEAQVSLTDSMKERFKERYKERYKEREKSAEERRFIWGWDTVADPNNTLAGNGAPPLTFGHLGFTGTSIWIDAESSRGWVLLTNATKKFWYHRQGLAQLRKSLGEYIWKLI